MGSTHVHVKNIEKYYVNYKDRHLTWCKTYFSMINSDPEFEMLCEIDKWRFISFVMLELQIKKPVPIDAIYLTRKGFDLKKRPMSLTLHSLQDLIITVTDALQNSNTEIEIEIDTEIEKEIESYGGKSKAPLKGKAKARADLKEVVRYWNIRCDETRNAIPRCLQLSSSREAKLAQRWKDSQFQSDYKKAIDKVMASEFCSGLSPNSTWKASFDWFIANDNNYLKALEGKYDNRTTANDLSFLEN